MEAFSTDSRVANTASTMPVTPRARVHTSRFYHHCVSTLPLTKSLAVTHHLKTPATLLLLNMASHNTARRDTSSSRATDKRVVIPTLPTTLTLLRAKKVSAVLWVLLVVD